MVLRLESSGAQPAMISSSYTSESQARHREQLDSRICRQRLGKHVVRPGLLPRLPPQGPGAVGVPPPHPPPAVCTGGAILTSREGGWQDPGVSLRCSEEWRRLRPLTEDSERSHSLPREAELCHYVRKHGQPAPCPCLPGCWLRPPLGPLWHAAFAAPQP